MTAIALAAVVVNDTVEAFEVARDAFMTAFATKTPVAVYFGREVVIVQGDQLPEDEIPRAAEAIRVARMKERLRGQHAHAQTLAALTGSAQP